MKEKLIFFGDLLYDYADMKEDLQDLGSWISRNHYHTVLNLEGGLSNDLSSLIQKRGKHLYSNEKVLDILELLQTVGVCLANNHIMDFGKSGLERSLALLDKRGLPYIGAGVDLKHASKPLNLYMEGHRIIILNYGWDKEETVYATDNSPGCSPREKSFIISQIKKYKAELDENDRIIVCIHWGFEYNRLPQPYDIELGHAMIDVGADLVIGHHPHVIQAKEIYKGKTIYYSLGNFYVGSKRNRYNRQFNEVIANQSDFSLGIIWDPENEEIDEILLEFDRKKQTTNLIVGPDQKNSDMTVLNVCLEDISGIDYLSLGYKIKAASRKKNINPILGINEKHNQNKLRRLAIRRKIRGLAKLILITKSG